MNYGGKRSRSRERDVLLLWFDSEVLARRVHGWKEGLVLIAAVSRAEAWEGCKVAGAMTS